MVSVVLCQCCGYFFCVTKIASMRNRKKNKKQESVSIYKHISTLFELGGTSPMFLAVGVCRSLLNWPVCVRVCYCSATVCKTSLRSLECVFSHAPYLGQRATPYTMLWYPKPSLLTYPSIRLLKYLWHKCCECVTKDEECTKCHLNSVLYLTFLVCSWNKHSTYVFITYAFLLTS